MFWFDKVEEEKLIRIIKILFLSCSKKKEKKKKTVVFIKKKNGEGKNLVKLFSIITAFKLNFYCYNLFDVTTISKPNFYC